MSLPISLALDGFAFHGDAENSGEVAISLEIHCLCWELVTNKANRQPVNPATNASGKSS